MLIAETGIIGVPLPMDRVRTGLPRVQLRADGGHEAALAIMTTDTRAKESAVTLDIGGREVRIGAMTKGVGMIHPNMATMLAFIATDATLEPAFARTALKRAVERSFNMITVDGDTSTNDSLLAGQRAGRSTEADAMAVPMPHALSAPWRRSVSISRARWPPTAKAPRSSCRSTSAVRRHRGRCTRGRSGRGWLKPGQGGAAR